MTDPTIPVTADDVDYDFDANASPPPGCTIADTNKPGVRRVLNLGLAPDPRLVADPNAADPGHLAEPDEWAEIVARAEGKP